MQQGWLCSWLDGMPRVPVGSQGPIWTLPPRDAVSRQIIRRTDGSPYERAWRPGDIAVVYHPDSERCVAVLEITGWPVWTDRDEVWDTMTTVLAEDVNGPRLAEVGLSIPAQGGRERIKGAQLDAVLAAFDSEWSDGVQVLDTVTYRVLPDGPETTRRIVRATGPKDEGEISEASPIARALLGSQVGDEIRVVLPIGVRTVVLLGVSGPTD